MPDDDEVHAATAANVALQHRRNLVRSSLLRANTAVALVLLVVIALATAAVWLGWRATRLRDDAQANQHRAEQAEAKARSDLGRAYLSEAKATRLGNAVERRAAALESIQRAAAIAPSPELRNEAVATLALPDFKLDSSLPFDPSVIKATFDPTMQRAALCLTNGDVVIRALADGHELQRLKKVDGDIPPEQSRPASALFSKDGKRLSVRYNGGAVAVWDLETGRVIFQHNADKQRHLVADAHFSRDSRFVVGPVLAPRDGMAVLEIATGREVAFYPEFNSYRHASVHPIAPIFAANNGTNVVTVNWQTGERHEFPFDAGVRRTAWSPDGRELAIVGNLVDVHVWNVAERTRRVFTGHKGDVFEAVFDPTGTRLATSSEDGSSRIWDLRNNRLIGVTADGHITAWGENDRLGCVRGPGLEVRRFVPSTVYQSIPGLERESEARTLDVSADGNWAISILQHRGLLVWNLRAPAAPQWVPLQGVLSVCFHPREPQLFVTLTNQVETYPFAVASDGAGATLELGRPVIRSHPRRRRYDRVTLSATGDALGWVELAGGNVWVEQLSSTNRVRMRTLHSSVAYQSSSPRGGGTVSISPDGRLLACGYGLPGLDICDARTGERVAQLTRRQGNVHFSLDGRHLAFAERDVCRIYRTSDWSVAWETRCTPSATFVGTAAFSPDGKLVVLATSPRSAKLFDVASGRELAQLEAPSPAPIAAARWTPDGERIVFSTRENQLDVWRPAILQNHLSALGLGWDSVAPPTFVVASATVRDRASPAWMGAGVMATVALAAVVATLSLRRHRRLIEDFSRTEALAAQRELELQGEREVSRLKSSFVSMVSHEFRTPLGIIQSSAQILDRYLERLSPERRSEQLESINRNVQRMADLIDEVLLIGKVEAGQMGFAPAPMDLACFCRRLVDEMDSATHRRCPIRLMFETAELPLAHADESLLRHVLGNLISNAVKYSVAGCEVEFHVARRERNAVFTIRDCGIGIPASDRDKLFVAFQRASNAAHIHGTGLGLTIVKRCVERHGGEISFTSEEGRGTTFTVAIPTFPEQAATGGG